MTTIPELPLILSFTSLSSYLNCPKKFFHMYIGKDAKEKKSYQQLGGIDVHEALRKRLRLREKLPEQLAREEAVCSSLEQLEGIRHVETKFAVDGAGKRCEYTAPQTAFRGIADLIITNSPNAFILDWKTGKPWEDPLELRTLAVLIRARYPDLTWITGAYYWLRKSEMGVVHPIVNDTAGAWDKIHETAWSIYRRIETGDWPADENPLCPWCPVSKAQCQFKKDPPK